MPTTHKLLSWLGLHCFIPVLIPMIHQEKVPDGTRDNFTIGLPFSPWLVAHRTVIKEEKKEEAKTENSFSSSSSFSMRFEQGTSVEFISWSSLLAVMGIVLLWLGRRFKPKELSGKAVQEVSM